MRSARDRVLATPAAKLAPIGRHVIVGYRDPTELTRLIALGAVGGVFVTARNAQALSVDELAAEIAGFQATARTYGHPPLIIATDQEGGMIARLSPPLSRPPSLAVLLREMPDGPLAIRDAADAAGRDLVRVGVTLNFAPVVDLDFGIRNPDDRHSRIGERAISSDPAVVIMAARAYCEGLALHHVICTLKHFPGLGRVSADTHVGSASLATARVELERMDWRPFREVFATTSAAVMVGHVAADALDRSRPASTSRAVIDVLRKDWNFSGLIVTDDLTMAATMNSQSGVGGAAVAAISAGVDLLLVSWDVDQVYSVLDALLRSHAAGQLDGATLAASAQRLDRHGGKRLR